MNQTTIQRFDVAHGSPKWRSEIALHNGVAYLAGQVPEDACHDIRGQMRQVLAAVDVLLARGCSDKSRILMTQVYLADLSDFEGMNEAWDAWFASGHTPPRATLRAALA